MANRIVMSGLGAGAVGALSCLIPGVGPAVAGAIAVSFATTGAGIGWKATQAELATEVAHRALQGADRIGEKALKAYEVAVLKVGEGAASLLETTGEIVKTWNAVLLALAADGCLIAYQKAVQNDFCLNLVVTGGSVILTTAIVGKVGTQLFEMDKLQKTKQSDVSPPQKQKIDVPQHLDNTDDDVAVAPGKSFKALFGQAAGEIKQVATKATSAAAGAAVEGALDASLRKTKEEAKNAADWSRGKWPKFFAFFWGAKKEN